MTLRIKMAKILVWILVAGLLFTFGSVICRISDKIFSIQFQVTESFRGVQSRTNNMTKANTHTYTHLRHIIQFTRINIEFAHREIFTKMKMEMGSDEKISMRTPNLLSRAHN